MNDLVGVDSTNKLQAVKPHFQRKLKSQRSLSLHMLEKFETAASLVLLSHWTATLDPVLRGRIRTCCVLDLQRKSEVCGFSGIFWMQALRHCQRAGTFFRNPEKSTGKQRWKTRSNRDPGKTFKVGRVNSSWQTRLIFICQTAFVQDKQ